MGVDRSRLRTLPRSVSLPGRKRVARCHPLARAPSSPTASRASRSTRPAREPRARACETPGLPHLRDRPDALFREQALYVVTPARWNRRAWRRNWAQVPSGKIGARLRRAVMVPGATRAALQELRTSPKHTCGSKSKPVPFGCSCACKPVETRARGAARRAPHQTLGTQTRTDTCRFL